jgi:hypothetical protein
MKNAYRYVYVATMDGYTKIGATRDPKSRVRARGMPAVLVKVWEHADPSAIEMMCGDAWSNRRAWGMEYFHATTDEAVALVEQMIGRYASGERPISTKLRAQIKASKRAKQMLLEGASMEDIIKAVRPVL